MNGTLPTTLSAVGESAVASVGLPDLRPPAIPDHELLRRIGGGAYGDVWLARNILGELRAVKVIHRSRFTDARPFEREFEGIQRFEPISRSHPSQLSILHVGKNDAVGCFYYVMELADDANVGQASSLSGAQGDLPTATGKMPVLRFTPRTLRHDLDQHGRLSIPDCIQIGLSLTTALAHLHQHGLVHRDIKPSNVIFVNGVPKLGDIGLVTDAGDTQSIVGTEGYIPPEGPGTPQADIFSLGKVLYEISTGLDRRRFAELPEDLRSWPDREAVVEFNEILLKACAKDPARRYQSAEELRADLELLQRGQSVKRRRAWRRTLAFARRLALAVAAVAAVSGLAFWLSDWPSYPSKSARPSQLDFVWSTNAEAQEEFRKGMLSLHSLYARDNSLQAIQHLQLAVDLDPNFADAWAQLAGAWNSAAGIPNQGANVRMAAERAFSLNPNSALANSMLTMAKCSALDWAGAEEARLRAITLAPNSEEILLRSALNLAITGRAKEALACLDKALRANPTSASNLRTIYSGYAYAWSGQYDRAIEIFNQFPDADFWMKEQHAQAYLAKDDYPNAIRLQRQAALARGGNTNQVDAKFDKLETAFRAGGKEAYWKLRLQFETPKTGGEHWIRMAEIYARLNQPAEAFDNLRQAKQKSPGNFAFIYTNPGFDSLREDPQFLALIAELWRKK